MKAIQRRGMQSRPKTCVTRKDSSTFNLKLSFTSGAASVPGLKTWLCVVRTSEPQRPSAL
ncbi:hypothetical protein E2C01_071812 [Portunus trituberculatus]|uniref:Uncharacterized protein n=1 Tax=Portunus trituberculatus TaxID=210409 RepID=A0A5B7HY06_PORTR|nr:hypothetical protein [Portunus trituberculatus]